MIDPFRMRDTDDYEICFYQPGYLADIPLWITFLKMPDGFSEVLLVSSPGDNRIWLKPVGAAA